MIGIITREKRNYRFQLIDEKSIDNLNESFPVEDYMLHIDNNKPVKIIPIPQNNNRRSLKNPRDFIEFVHKIRIIVTEPNILNGFMERYHIKAISPPLCYICLNQGKYTVIKSNYILYKKKKICKNCAIRELKKEFHYWFDEHPEVDLEPIIRKSGSLDRAMTFLDRRINPVDHPEKTLYKISKKTESSTENMTLENLSLPVEFSEILKKRGISKLTEIQTLAVKNGLLDNISLLIVSSTASGKTLIGELAGIPKAMKARKMIYLVPLVAIANQKYYEFSEWYKKIGLSVAIRAGFNKTELPLDINTDINSSIIIATYEGFDHLLRCGASPENIGTIIIDEIHMLNDSERGPRLDGLIARLRYFYPHAQIIGLSATIGNPKELAESLKLRLVQYYGRPVSLEKHLVFVRDGYEKLLLETEYIKKESQKISKQGSRGQTILFTNSRRRCEELAAFFRKKGLAALPYHSGLTYKKRKSVELDFISGRLEAVISTAALGAGVDFPASQIIFDSLCMGREWLTVQEFEQMCGRAGRPDYHESGSVIVLAEVGKNYHHGQKDTEEIVAFRLLDGVIENISVDSTQDQENEQLLACKVSAIPKKNISDILYSTLGFQSDVTAVEKILTNAGLIKSGKITVIGEITSRYFLTIRETKYIIANIEEKPEEFIKSFIPFDRVYLTKTIIKKIEKTLDIKSPTGFFDGRFLDIYYSNIDKLRIPLKEFIENIETYLFNCHCSSKPFCGCPEKKFTDYILNLRKSGLRAEQISKRIYRDYRLLVYEGDIYRWLDSVIRYLDARNEFALVIEEKKAWKYGKTLRKKLAGNNIYHG